MRRIIYGLLLPVFIIGPFLSTASQAQRYNGSIKLGQIFVDEEAGDLSVIQETYNLYESFSISQLQLDGYLTPRSYFSFNLSNINLDNRKGRLDFRLPGYLKLYAKYDQHRQVFDANRNLVSNRKDWQFGASATPIEWLGLSSVYNLQTRDGNRASYPISMGNNLGNRYDYKQKTGMIEARIKTGSRFFSFNYNFSSFSNGLSNAADRTGKIFSVRLFTPCFFTDKYTHMVKAAYGVQELSVQDLNITFKNFQYIGEGKPINKLKLKGGFYAGRTDDEATDLVTDNYSLSFDAAYRCPYGSLSGGYGYETNDDDLTLTSYHIYHTSVLFKCKDRVSIRARYSNRTKKDIEKLTLFQESQTASISSKLLLKVTDDISAGGQYDNRSRDFPDIGVKSDGKSINCFMRYDRKELGALMLDYTYSKDKYYDHEGSFKTRNHTFASRMEINLIKDVTLSGGAALVDIGEDLDIEKSIIFLESAYTFRDNYKVELKYNAYNFDDYLLIDRYYTTNVVWLNFGYSFQTQ